MNLRRIVKDIAWNRFVSYCPSSMTGVAINVSHRGVIDTGSRLNRVTLSLDGIVDSDVIFAIQLAVRHKFTVDLKYDVTGDVSNLVSRLGDVGFEYAVDSHDVASARRRQQRKK